MVIEDEYIIRTGRHRKRICLLMCDLSNNVFCSWRVRDVWTGVESFDPTRHTGRHTFHQRARVRTSRGRRVRLPAGLWRRPAVHSRHGLLRAQRCVPFSLRCLFRITVAVAVRAYFHYGCALRCVAWTNGLTDEGTRVIIIGLALVLEVRYSPLVR